MSATDWILAGATVAIAVVTCVQARLAWLQWRAFLDQRNWMKKAAEATESSLADTKKAVEEAGRSADAMEKVATATMKSGREQTRAYLSPVVALTPLQQRDDSDPGIDVKLVVTNVGRTPAYNVRYATFTGSGLFGSPRNFDLRQPSQYYTCARVLNPNQQHHISIPLSEGVRGISPDWAYVMEEAERGERYVVIWGTFLYRDIFYDELSHEERHIDICTKIERSSPYDEDAGWITEDIEGYSYNG